MSQKQDHTRLKYLVSYTLAMTAAFLTFKSFYIFQGSSKFGVETVGLNFGILLFLWFLSFIHTGFIRRNIFMVLLLPLAGLQITNLMLLLASPGVSNFGYIAFVSTRSILVFASYTARNYERQL